MNIAPITFCDRFAFNVRNEEFKTAIFESLFDKYNIIATDNSCKIYNRNYASLIGNQKYILSTNTRGNRYFLYMTRNEFDENFCYFIDRKICKGYAFPRVIYTKCRFTDDVFNGTLLHGELVKDYNGGWQFIFNDMVVYCGKTCQGTKFTRVKQMYELLNTKYQRDSTMDVCKFMVKRYFSYLELDTLINDFKID